MSFKLIKWIVFSNLWVSLGVASFTYFVYQTSNITLDKTYVILTFFATFFAYNFQRLIKLNADISQSSERHFWIKNHKKAITIATALSLLVTVIIGLQAVDYRLYLFAAPLVLIVILYAGNQKFNIIPIRSIPIIKIFVISSVWTLVIVVFPFLIAKQTLTVDNMRFVLACFLFILVLCLPFDIRDLETDSGKIKTIPSVIGIKGSKIFGSLLLIIAMIITINFHLYGFSLTMFIGLISLLYTSPTRPELFFTGWIDGLFILLPIIHELVSNYY